MSSSIQEQDYTQKFSLSLWRRILNHTPQYKPMLVWLMVCMGISAVIDVAFPMMTRYAIDHFIAERTTEGLPGFIALYALLTLTQVVTIYCFLYLGGKIETGVCYEMRCQGFRKLQELPFSYYDKMPVGYLMSRLTSDSVRLSETVGWSLLDLSWGVVYLILSIAAMLSVDVRLTLLVLLVVPPLGAVSWFFQQRILKAHRGVRKINSQITGSFNEGIMGAKTTKTLVREKENLKEFEALTENMRSTSVRAASLSALYLPIVVSLGSIATAIALWQTGNMALAGALKLGTVMLFINYPVQFFDPIRGIAGTFSEMQSAQAAAERVVSLLETEPGIKDTEEVIERFGDSFHPKKENWPDIRGDIEFDHVDFQYQDGEKVLEDFNLRVRAGETVALVGPTGAGKSTVVNLVCRFYEPTKGKILIDGVDYRERSQLWLQSNLGYVLQEPHLFSGTVMDNIRYSRLDATDEEVMEAARLVSADTFIQRLDKGYQTEVGEGGSRLSTGEKQLISFARALLASPAIFVLDEATSSVDTHTEQVIQQAIEKVLAGRTSFIIAHRLSTVRNADRILVIDGGKIAESGTHQELMSKKGAYWRLYTTQFREEKEQELLGGKGNT